MLRHTGLFIAASRVFSSCGERGLISSCRTRASHCSGFSCCGAWAQKCVSFSGCGSWALEHRLSSCGTRALLSCGLWNLPGPGIKPMSPYIARQIFNHWTTRDLPGFFPSCKMNPSSSPAYTCVTRRLTLGDSFAREEYPLPCMGTVGDIKWAVERRRWGERHKRCCFLF